MAKSIEAIVEEPEQDIPSAIRFTEENAMKNPLFLEALNSIKDPKDKEAFLGYFRRYLTQAYNHNPALKRMMKSYDLSNKINDLPEEAKDHRQMLAQRAYSEPGRSYHYINNFMGQKKKKKDLLKRTYHATLGIAKDAWPGIAALGGWYYGNQWYTNERIKGLTGRVSEKALETITAPAKSGRIFGFLKYANPMYYLGELGEFLGNETLLATIGKIRMPSLYLIGGYLLYKTIRYFIKKHRDKVDLEEIEKMERLRRGVGLQNQMLHQMAIAA